MVFFGFILDGFLVFHMELFCGVSRGTFARFHVEQKVERELLSSTNCYKVVLTSAKLCEWGKGG